MKPDQHGRYGFNVKGGADQNYPVIVSRVAPGGAADKCNPRLNEGDQVAYYFINWVELLKKHFIKNEVYCLIFIEI